MKKRRYCKTITSCARGAPGVGFIALILFMICAGPVADTPLHAQNESDAAFEKITDLPPWFIQPFGIVQHRDHPRFGQYSSALGDVNGDGYDDIAVSTGYDTTFLFFGGDTLDPHEDGFILGGSAGVAALDLNGDGRKDLITSMDPLHTPDESGMVRIYIQLAETPYFREKPDLVLTGVKKSRLGVAPPNRCGVGGLDYNGDGYDDLLIRFIDRQDSSGGRNLLYLGGLVIDTIVDREFRSSRSSRDASYCSDYMCGDLNGDGFEDVMIGGRVYDWNRARYNFYWDLYLGNAEAKVTTPYRFFDQFNGWSPYQQWSGILDVNADGYADIIDKSVHREQGDALVFLSSSTLPPLLMPNDSIPNRDPGLWGDAEPYGAYPVGDMNGDGTRDLIIPWSVYMVYGPLYLMYPSGATSFYRPMGYRGILATDWSLEVGTYDAGDMNGDGYDDIVMLGKPFEQSEGYHNRFVIFLGAKQMQTSVGEAESSAPEKLDLQVFPNPLPIGCTDLSLSMGGLSTGSTLSITIFDALGRAQVQQDLVPSAPTLSHQISLPSLPAGIYHLTVRQGRSVTTVPITMY
ncbi:MAG: T9SS type A sorting domain-containing protein [Bacteroidota bacterium]